MSLCYQQMQKLLQCTVALMNQTALRALCFFFKQIGAVVSVSILALLYKSQLCLLLIFTSRHDESLAIMSDHCRITLNSGPFLGRDRYISPDIWTDLKVSDLGYHTNYG